MPPSPELCYGCAYVRVVKVFVEMESEASSKAYCHIGVAGEVIVDLEGECQKADPASRSGECLRIGGQEIVSNG